MPFEYVKISILVLNDNISTSDLILHRLCHLANDRYVFNGCSLRLEHPCPLQVLLSLQILIPQRQKETLQQIGKVLRVFCGICIL